MTTEEPSYLMFARANARDNIPSTATIVKPLIDRLDEQAETIRILVRQLEEAEAKSRNSGTKAEPTCAHCQGRIEYTHYHDTTCARYPLLCGPERWLHLNRQAQCVGRTTYATPKEDES